MVFKERGKARERTGRDWMDAMTHTLPRLRLTVPLPMKRGKVGSHLDLRVKRVCVF